MFPSDKEIDAMVERWKEAAITHGADKIRRDQALARQERLRRRRRRRRVFVALYLVLAVAWAIVILHYWVR